jgi:hypothetical protein
MERKLIEDLASALMAWRTCREKLKTARANAEIGRLEDNADTHYDHALKLVHNCLPSGSGFDRGTVILLHKCGPEKLHFTVDFHHTDESGAYDGWTTHDVVVKPSFLGLNIRVTGTNRNDIKVYIEDTFHEMLLNVADRAHLNPWVTRVIA